MLLKNNKKRSTRDARDTQTGLDLIINMPVNVEVKP